MVTSQQYIDKLGAWKLDIDAKISTLGRGSRFYLGFGYLTLISIGVLSVILIGLDSYFISDPNISGAARLGILITALVLQVILAICNGIDKIIKPSHKANDLSMCAKFYSQLARELEVNIEQAKYDLEDSGNYLAVMTNLFMREQIIHQLEPGMVWIGHKGIIMKSMPGNTALTADEIEWISSLINRHRGRKRERLVEIFNRVLSTSQNTSLEEL